ncbi:MAG: molybdate ABC transporter permease subunit [Caldilineales bacterium]|nr:molybdate ABC transporter permease subunit [Caldilineales bacterium]MDW8316708.1 molybdate ABC transporter permease subunit [Anaerolineae bacterium]
MNWDALRLSLLVTAVATALMVAVGLPLSLLLARRRFRGQTLVETLVTLPLVLPPTVVGYYLLVLLGRNGPLVRWFDVQVLFTWLAAALASAVVGLPLLVQAARAAFAGVDRSLENAARTLGSSELEVFWRVTLPLARRGILAGLVMASARALGEFGATLMVAGSIPGRTQTLPLAIYDAVQSRDYAQANLLVAVTTALALLSLWAVRCVEASRDPAQRGG